MPSPRFQLVPGARLAAGAGGGVGWRLLGANNRELARSATSYADAESALDSISRVRELASCGAAHIVHDSRSGLWVWRLGDQGAFAARSGRGFRQERQCRYNLEQFRGTAPSAPASDTDVPVEFPWQRTVMLPVQQEATP